MNIRPPKGSGPIPEVGAIPGRPAAGGEQALVPAMFPKIRKSRKSPIGLVSEIKLIRTDTTL